MHAVAILPLLLCSILPTFFGLFPTFSASLFSLRSSVTFCGPRLYLGEHYWFEISGKQSILLHCQRQPQLPLTATV